MTIIVGLDMSIICGCSSHDDTPWNKLCKRLPARGCRREWRDRLPCTRLTEVALDPLQQHRTDRNEDQGERHQQRRPPRPQLDSKGWLEHASRPGVAGSAPADSIQDSCGMGARAGGRKHPQPSCSADPTDMSFDGFQSREKLLGMPFYSRSSCYFPSVEDLLGRSQAPSQFPYAARGVATTAGVLVS